uniref:DUF7595 domain-containing protein n=1 Tax=Oryza meridionalis TaxID=40149 RepID=A0A0E0D7K8_9ORYZ
MQPVAKRLRARAAATAEARTTTTTLPVDLLLEIVVRLDAATTVRCAAAGKSIRRAILQPSFRRSSLALCAAANGGGFDPALLFAVSYKLARLDDPPVLVVEDPQSAAGGAAAPFAVSGKFLRRIVEPPPPPPSSYRPVLPIYKAYDSELKHSETVASRDVLVVLRKRPVGVRAFCTVPRQQLCICNSLTGDTTRLPMSDVVDEYPPAFLATGGAGRSYELLVMNKRLQTQTFSSEDGKWGAIRAIEELPHPISSPLYAHRPLFVSRRNAVYWLCPERLGGVTADQHILTVDVGAGRRRASRIELPPDCLSRMKPFGWQIRRDHPGALAVAGRGAELDRRRGPRDIAVDAAAIVVIGGIAGGEVEQAGGDQQAGDRQAGRARHVDGRRLLPWTGARERRRAHASSAAGHRVHRRTQPCVETVPHPAALGQDEQTLGTVLARDRSGLCAPIHEAFLI